jgi:hypothetical protein
MLTLCLLLCCISILLIMRFLKLIYISFITRLTVTLVATLNITFMKHAKVKKLVIYLQYASI